MLEKMHDFCVAESRAPLSYRMAVGDSFPLYSTSAGKAILAAMPAARRQAYLKNVRLQAQTPATATTLAVLKRQLEEVGESGIAYSRGEHTPGVVGMRLAEAFEALAPHPDQEPT